MIFAISTIHSGYLWKNSQVNNVENIIALLEKRLRTTKKSIFFWRISKESKRRVIQ